MICNLLSLLLVGLTAIAVVITAVKLANDLDVGIVCIILFTVFLGIVGWGMMGHMIPAERFAMEHNAQVIKTPVSLIIVEYGKPILTVTDVYHYNYFSNLQPVVIIETGWVDIYENTNWNRDYKFK